MSKTRRAWQAGTCFAPRRAMTNSRPLPHRPVTRDTFLRDLTTCHGRAAVPHAARAVDKRLLRDSLLGLSAAALHSHQCWVSHQGGSSSLVLRVSGRPSHGRRDKAPWLSPPCAPPHTSVLTATATRTQFTTRRVRPSGTATNP